MNPRYRFHRQAGVGLVEIMVAVTLSLILMAGLVQVYTGNKQTYRIQEALSRVQENGRFALDFITRDLRSAGFLGCAGTSTKIINPLSGFEWNFESDHRGAIRFQRRRRDRQPLGIQPLTRTGCAHDPAFSRQSGPGRGPPGYQPCRVCRLSRWHPATICNRPMW